MKKSLALLVILFGASGVAVAQAQPANGVALTEMKKLEFLVGEWKGTGWMQMGPGQKAESVVNENVQAKLGGRVLIIEGLGRARSEGSSEGRVVHNAFAFLYYDQEAGRFRMRAFLANGQAVDADTSFKDGVFEWGFQVPQGKIQYRTRLNPKQQWFEEGSISLDGGKTYQKFFEMTLDRVK